MNEIRRVLPTSRPGAGHIPFAAAAILARMNPVGVAPALRLRGTWHWLAGHPRRARAPWRRSIDRSLRPHLAYDEALGRYELGRRGDHDQLDRAERIFETLGATVDLSRARAARMG